MRQRFTVKRRFHMRCAICCVAWRVKVLAGTCWHSPCNATCYSGQNCGLVDGRWQYRRSSAEEKNQPERPHKNQHINNMLGKRLQKSWRSMTRKNIVAQCQWSASLVYAGAIARFYLFRSYKLLCHARPLHDGRIAFHILLAMSRKFHKKPK